MHIFEVSVFTLIFSSLVLDFGSAQSTTPVIRVQPNTNWCLGCICEAISSCNRTLRCEGDVCGLFRITWGYWFDAGKPTVKNVDPNSKTAYANCTNDEACAGTTVSQYLKKFSQDCNQDGTIDCYDYAAIHLYGGYGGCVQKPLTGDYFNKFSACEKHIQSLGAGSQS